MKAIANDTETAVIETTISQPVYCPHCGVSSWYWTKGKCDICKNLYIKKEIQQ
jgi:hypothetical protein